MKERRRIFKFLLCSGFILTMVIGGRSVGHTERLKVGPLEIHPYLQVSETYETNVFRCDEEAGTCAEESDFFTVVTPGIQILLPRKNQSYQVEYRGDFAFYTDFASEEYTDHEVGGEASFDLTELAYLKVKDRFTDGHDSREISPLKEIDEFIENRLETEIGFSPRPGVELAAAVGHNLIDYEAKPATDFRDRQELVFSGRGAMRIISDTSALLEYTFTRADYKDAISSAGNLRNETHEVQGGVSFKVGTRSEGRATGGYLIKLFDEPAREDFSTGVFTVHLDYAFPTETRLRIQGGREVKEPDWIGTHLYVTTGGAVSVMKKLAPKLDGSVSASYGQDSYFQNPADPGRSRKDKTVRAQAGFDYSPVRWLTAGIQYDFSSTDSNWFANRFDFVNHAFTVKVAAFY